MNQSVSRKQKAYILIRVQPGKEVELYDGLKQIPNIVGIDFVRGSFDFIVLAEGTGNEVEKVVFEVRKLLHIISTETLTCFETLPWEELSGRLDYGHV